MDENILDNLQTELKSFIAKAQAEQKDHGTVLAETKAAIEAVQRQADAIDLKMQANHAAATPKTLAQDLAENESMLKLARDGQGTATLKFKSFAELERKTTITSAAVGSATSGVLNPERMAGIVQLPQVRLFLRDVLPSAPTSANAIDFVKQNVFTNAASPQTPAEAKAEAALTYTTGTAAVRTLAHWIPATKQVLDDFAGLEADIRNTLVYGYKLIEERQMLSGDNTGQNLNGLITQATAFNTALLNVAGGYKKADILARSIQQLQSANQPDPDWFALNPADWWDIMLTKESTGGYVAGNAYNQLTPTLWGKRVVVSNNITAGTFLSGNSMNAMIRDREGVNVTISTEHSDYFVKNLVAVRVEGRLTIVVTVPASFIYGSLSNSPA